MSEKKYSFRTEIKYQNQQAREEQAQKDFKRNIYGLSFSAIVFFAVLLAVLNGLVKDQNPIMILLIASMMGVFYFGRELRVLPKGQIIFSGVKAVLCIGLALSYVVMHKGLWDWMDFSILAILIGVVLLDIPRVLNAKNAMKS